MVLQFYDLVSKKSKVPPLGETPPLGHQDPTWRPDGKVLLYVRNGDEALAAVRGLGLEPQTSLVRRSTLEDVFLRLTGRRLED